MSEKIYTYVENGAGIAGLPQRITTDDLVEMSADTRIEFQAALKRGAYKLESDPLPALPQIGERDLGEEKPARKIKPVSKENDYDHT